MSEKTNSETIGDKDSYNFSPNTIGMALMVLPNACGWYAASRPKGSTAIINFVLRTGGVPGLFALPFVTLTMEKCYYDSVLSLQGSSPNQLSPDRVNEGYPSGGHMLPSLSLFPVRHISEYFK